MKSDYDEVIAEMLIQLDLIERRFTKADKRIELTIKRLVKAETRMELFEKRLELLIKDQREFNKTQTKINKYFLEYIKKNPLK